MSRRDDHARHLFVAGLCCPAGGVSLALGIPTSLGAARSAVPENRVVVSHVGVHATVVALAALEADGSGRAFRTVEVGRVRDHRGDEVGHLAGGTVRGSDVAFVVEVVSGIDHVHGVCSSLPGASVCLSIGTASSIRQQDRAESGLGGSSGSGTWLLSAHSHN